ncbi:hypothetical protein MHYP_G00365330 [Metynnis hypsauchen]
MWREDSLEVSLSDVSLENLTSTEEMADAPDSTRANSLDELYGPQSHGRYAKRQKGGSVGADSEEDKMLSPCDDDGANYGAFTLPCRRSHCLSEGVTSHQGAMQGRRAQTIQPAACHLLLRSLRGQLERDVTAADGSELEDSGIDGLIGDSAASQPRRYKAMSASFSAYSTTCRGAPSPAATAAAAAGLDQQKRCSGQDLTEQLLTSVSFNSGRLRELRQELEKSVCQADAGGRSASVGLSDEHSSLTLSSAYHTEPLLGLAYHTEPLLGRGKPLRAAVRKAAGLTVKNLLVHKKNKKVELAARRKWKSYWVSLKVVLKRKKLTMDVHYVMLACFPQGALCFLRDGRRSGIDHTSVPKHAVWAGEQYRPRPCRSTQKRFRLCLSNSMGDSYLFQVNMLLLFSRRPQ